MRRFVALARITFAASACIAFRQPSATWTFRFRRAFSSHDVNCQGSFDSEILKRHGDGAINDTLATATERIRIVGFGAFFDRPTA